MSDWNDQEEPAPIPNGFPAVWDLVMDDIRLRDSIGVKTYGTRLQPFNGRRALRDAYFECLDMAVYLRQKIWEDEHPKVRVVLPIFEVGADGWVRCPECRHPQELQYRKPTGLYGYECVCGHGEWKAAQILEKG